MKVFKTPLLLLLLAYRRMVSPFLPPACRFYPTCSQYCTEALQRHSLPKALQLSLKRLFRCHPWGGCGHDPVPE